MAHFAKIENDTVIQVIVVSNDVLLNDEGIETESLGAQFCHDLFDGEWIQTSYNSNFRGVFAGIGMIYDRANDLFIPLDNGYDEASAE
jgi:hypothetical protein